MIIEPYLFYEGRCDEAIEFYRTALDAEVTAMYRFKDSPEPEECPPGQEEKVMHANLQIGNTTVMVSDGYCQGQSNFQGFALSITADDEEQARRYFGALLDGGGLISG